MHTKTAIAAAAMLLATVSACKKPEAAPEAAASDAAASEAPAASQAPTMPPPGTYESTSQDGKPVSKVTLNPDGGYSRVPANGPTEAGIAKMTDGKLCFDPSGKEKPERCYTLSPAAADGSFTATDEKGVVLNVKPAA